MIEVGLDWYTILCILAGAGVVSGLYAFFK